MNRRIHYSRRHIAAAPLMETGESARDDRQDTARIAGGTADPRGSFRATMTGPVTLGLYGTARFAGNAEDGEPGVGIRLRDHAGRPVIDLVHPVELPPAGVRQVVDPETAHGEQAWVALLRALPGGRADEVRRGLSGAVRLLPAPTGELRGRFVFHTLVEDGAGEERNLVFGEFHALREVRLVRTGRGRVLE